MVMMKSFISKIASVIQKQDAALPVNENLIHAEYINGGRVPWSEGYSRYRNALIADALNTPEILKCFAVANALPRGWGEGVDERCVEVPWIFSRYPKSVEMIMDAGCAYLKFDSIRRRLPPETSVTLVTLDKRDMAFPVPTKKVQRLEADLRNLPLALQGFDVITCISTLEHVGMDNTQLYSEDIAYREQSERDYLKAFEEFGRLLKKGGSLFLTIPFGARKNHGWLQVFDASMLDALKQVAVLEAVEEAIFRHESSGWTLVNRDIASQAVYFDVHACGINKISGRLAAAEAVACLWFKRK